jgi:transcriptional regulator with XRE-family HTH domain
MKLRGLRQARQRQGLSISQLADMTGLRRESISRFEHGQEEPQPYALRRLAAVLETSLAELSGLPADEAAAVSRPSKSRAWLLEELPSSTPAGS